VIKQNVRLQNSDKSFRCWLSVEEAERMCEEGKAVRVTRKKDPRPAYQMKWFPDASGSVMSSAQIMPSDTRRLVGEQRVDEIQIERLIGFSLLPEGTQVPEYGYL
jgi:hypothetical protein